MTNREVLISSLKDNNYDEYTVDYIACPYVVGTHTCEYDGKDNTPCCDCKMGWLEEEWVEL